jgi:hypothetical protein
MNDKEQEHAGGIEWHRMGLFKIQEVEPYPPLERQACVELLFCAALLVLAVHGESADLATHMPHFQKIVQTPYGVELAFAASQARKRGPWAWTAFAATLRLPGQHLLDAVGVRLAVQPKRTTRELLEHLRGHGDLSPDERDYFDRAIRAEIAPGLDGLEAYEAEASHLLASRKRDERRKGKRRTADVFDEIIKADWIMAGLWCRSTKGILVHYPELPQSTKEEIDKSLRRIDRAISDAGFSKSRHPENEAAILDAVAQLRCQIARLTSSV